MPVSGPAVLLRNTLGAAGRIVMLNESLTPPGVRKTSCVLPSIANGSWALICRGDTYITGIGCPLTVRQLSPRTVGNGLVREAWLTGLSPLPYRLINPPEATGW